MEGEKQNLAEWVDELYKESDRQVFEILHKIAALAVATSVNTIDK